MSAIDCLLPAIRHLTGPVPPGMRSGGRLGLLVMALWVGVQLSAVESGILPINQLADDGQIREWLVLGPFPLLDESAPGAEQQRLDHLLGWGEEVQRTWSAGLVGVDGRRRRPVAIRAWEGGYSEHRSYDGFVGYAASRLHCPVAGRYRLYLASNGSPRLWIDGTLVLSGEAPRHPYQRWQYGRWIDLSAGTHELRLAISNRRGYWGFQVECFDEEAHAAVWPSVVRRLELTALRRDADELVGLVQPRPCPVGVTLPIAIRCGLDAAVPGETGTPFRVPVPPGNPSIELQIAAAGIDQELRQACYGGDLEEAWQAIGRRLAELPALDSVWAPLLQDFRAWIQYRVSEPHDLLQEADVAQLQPIDALLQSWEAGHDPIAEYPWISFPARRRVDGIDWSYRFRITPGADVASFPILISLHGSGGTDRPIGIGGDPATPAAVDPALPPHLRLAPRAQSGIWWDSVALGRWLDDLQAELPFDRQRVSLTGFSMGGMATWSWASDQPQRFAALGPKAGYGDPTRTARLRQIPVWAVQGNRDQAIPPHLAERSVAALQSVGGQVRYTLLSDRGHGFGSAFDDDELDRWLLAQRRSEYPEPLPETVEEAGQVSIVERPARTLLTTALVSDPWSLDRDLTAAETRLASVWRRSGRLYDVAAELVIDDPATLQADRWAFRLQVPEEVPVDTWASEVQRQHEPARTIARMRVSLAGPDALAAALADLKAAVLQTGRQPVGPVVLSLDHRRRHGETVWLGALSVAVE